MILAYPEYKQHGETFAIYLAKKGIIPPKCCEHKPTIIDYCHNTIAIYLIKNNITVPK